MRYFITGATGFIGGRLAQRLAEEEHTVHALVRGRNSNMTPVHRNILVFQGDLSDMPAVLEAMKGCDTAFHLAAFTQAHANDPDLPYRTNVEGTITILNAAMETGIPKVVVVSSAATIQPSGDGPSDESTPRTTPYFNEYDATKAEAEEICMEYAKKGLDITMVNPSRVYGPGKLTQSNAATRIIKMYLKGTWRIVPGDGSKIGNYVFIDDVVDGIIQASKKGRPGERYILGGANLTFNEFFRNLGQLSGRRRIIVKLPYAVMAVMVAAMEGMSCIAGTTPPLTLSWLKKYLNHWAISSEKAARELDYTITPFDEGAKKTMEWLKN